MKQNFKNYLKKWGGVIAFLPLFVGCSPENDVIEYDSNSHHHARKISFEEFSNNQEALRSFNKIEDKNEARKSSRIIYDSINHFYIDTEKIMLSEENGQSYYTFLIHRDFETSKTENLVLKQDNSGQFIPLLLEYAFTEQDKQNINAGGSVADLALKTVIKQPEEIGLDGIFGNVSKYVSNCQTVTVSWCNSKWNHAGGYFYDGTRCEAYQEVSWQYCEGGNGGANSDPGYTPQPNQNPYVPHQGGQSGWGSTAGNNNPNQYIFTVPLVENWSAAQNKFIKNLPFQQRAWLMDPVNIASKNAVISYLITNQFSDESRDFVEEMIYAITFENCSLFNTVEFDDEIVTDLPTCLDSLVSDLKTLQNGLFGKTMQAFTGKNPLSLNFNWKIKTGSLTSTQAGSTSPTVSNHTVTTTINNSLINVSTDLSLARTLIHEAFHAYLVSIYRFRNMDHSYINLINVYSRQFNNDPNDTHHHVFTMSNIVSQIELALKEYGVSKGYNLPDEFYQDMAWGGLQGTAIYNRLPQGQKDRIASTISAEQFYTNDNINGITPKGNKICP